MKGIARSALVTISALLLVSIAALATYDMLVFQPRKADIRTILQSAAPEDRDPPPSIRRYILASHRPDYPASTVVARLLVARLDVSRDGSMLAWQAHTMLWDLLVSVHLSQDEVLALYSTLSYNGSGHGLSKLSQRLYAKPMSALSESEAATIVSITWSPSRYLGNQSLLNRRRDILMARARTGR